ncbi:MAG: phytanoyl-CoA dioxygenase family protein [Nannocystaceae bacterium]
MMSTIERLPVDAPGETVHEIIERDGCIILEGASTAAQVAELRAELEPHFEATPASRGDFYGHATKRVSSLIAKSPQCRRMAIHPAVLAIMDEFLLRGCSEYQLNLTQAIEIGPGEPHQFIHSDDGMFPFSHPGTETMINCMWAVDEFTADNGATLVVPGSHRWERDVLLPIREPTADEIVSGCMEPGSVLVYLGSLLHGGGANRSMAPRLGVILSYSLGWLRQSENHYLAVPKACAEQLPERLQRLLGYCVHMPNLGQVEGRDPIDWLRGEDIVNAGFEEFMPDEARTLLRAHRAEQLEKISRSETD